MLLNEPNHDIRYEKSTLVQEERIEDWTEQRRNGIKVEVKDNLPCTEMKTEQHNERNSNRTSWFFCIIKLTQRNVRWLSLEQR